jgi:ferric iron reductase protein FhuF
VTLPEVLAAVAGVVPYLRASTATEGADWCSCAQLVTDGPTLAGVIERATPGFETTEPAVAASLFTQAYAFRIAGVALAAYALGLPIPEVAPGATAVRLDKPRPTQIAHLAPDVHVMSPRQLSERLVSEHLHRLVTAVHARYRVGERLLWGNVASSCAVAFRAVEGATPDERAQVRQRAEAFVVATPSFRGLGRFTIMRTGIREGWYWDRTSCCLWFRTTEARYCDNCSLLGPETLAEERVRELSDAAK